MMAPYVETPYGTAIRENRVEEFLATVKGPYYDPRGRVLPPEAFTVGFRFRYYNGVNPTDSIDLTVVSSWEDDTIGAVDALSILHRLHYGTRLSDSTAL